MHTGPLENSHVANYRMALTNFPLHLSRKKWTEAERENLRKGIRQQFQEMVLQFSVDEFRYFQCLSYICTYQLQGINSVRRCCIFSSVHQVVTWAHQWNVTIFYFHRKYFLIVYFNCRQYQLFLLAPSTSLLGFQYFQVVSDVLQEPSPIFCWH